MKAPTIFGVAGRELGPYCRDSGTCFEWSVGPLCAFALDGAPDMWIGLWQLDNPRIELHRTAPCRLEYVTKALESWLWLHVAQLVDAMGLELRERAS